MTIDSCEALIEIARMETRGAGVVGVVLSSLVAFIGCSDDDVKSPSSGTSSGSSSSSGSSGTSGATSSQCQYKDPGTTFAPCSKDSDCFGSYCDLTGKPGPYCHVPGSTQVSNLHGITCKTDDECTRVLSSEAVSRGIVGKCQGRSNLDPAVCQYSCKFG
jgi:hypothetical protein